MNRSVRGYLALSFLAGLSWPSLAEHSSLSRLESAPQIAVRLFNYARVPPTSAADSQARPKITVRLYDYAGVPDDVLEECIPHADRVFRLAGVEIVWAACHTSSTSLTRGVACDQPFQTDHIRLRFVRRPMARAWEGDGEPPFGYAWPGASGGFGTTAGVFYHRTEGLMRRLESRSGGEVFSRPVILGHVIAHEIGHLLLGPHSHSRSGIMQFPLGPDQLRAMLTGNLLFSKEQSQSIRQNVRRRMAAAK